jgi:hypothetical protein
LLAMALPPIGLVALHVRQAEMVGRGPENPSPRPQSLAWRNAQPLRKPL